MNEKQGRGFVAGNPRWKAVKGFDETVMPRQGCIIARECNGIPYETIEGKPFFGPTRRARQALQAVTIPPCPQADFFHHVRVTMPAVYANIEWVRFWRFMRQDHDCFDYRIAVVFLRPVPAVREELFLKREEVTLATGWYPLVTGSRARVPRTTLARFMGKDLPLKVDIGKLESVVNMSAEPTGQSILLKGQLGSILLDTGFGVRWAEIDQLRAVFVSHFHRDHSGGLWELIRSLGVPVLMSRASLAQLALLAPPQMKNSLVGRVYLTEGQSYPESLSFFPTFHCPGSEALVYTGAGTTLVYLGDCCLGNGFLHFLPRLLSQLQKILTPRKWLILDGALVGKAFGSVVNEENSPELVLQKMVEGVQTRNVLFLSDSPELLVYAYLRAFHLTRATPGDSHIKLFINARTYELCRHLWGDVLARRIKDPVVSSLFGGSLSDFIESHRVYPLSALRLCSERENVVAFVTLRDVLRLDTVRRRIQDSNLLLVGTLALRSSLPRELYQEKPWQVLRVASPDWSFHSSERAILSFTESLLDVGWKVILFHNSAQQLEEFVMASGLDRDGVRVLSHEPIYL